MDTTIAAKPVYTTTVPDVRRMPLVRLAQTAAADTDRIAPVVPSRFNSSI